MNAVAWAIMFFASTYAFFNEKSKLSLEEEHSYNLFFGICLFVVIALTVNDVVYMWSRK